jgi:chromosome segregation ATPase
VTIALKDHEKLLTEVINEVNAMRNKYDAFSHFTESKIADYVNQRKQLNDRIEQLNDRIEQLNDRIEQLNDRIEQQIRDLAVTNAQRAQIQSELVNSTLLTDKFRISSRAKTSEFGSKVFSIKVNHQNRLWLSNTQ